MSDDIQERLNQANLDMPCAGKCGRCGLVTTTYECKLSRYLDTSFVVVYNVCAPCIMRAVAKIAESGG